MFIVACFSRETRSTTATSEEVTTLAKSGRRDRSATKETMAAVTATANQNRTAICSVQNNRTSVTPEQRECARDSDNPPCARSRHGKRLGSAHTPRAPMSSYCHMCGSVQKIWRLAGTPAWTILTDVCFWH